ncbi:MAG: helix-turn-helix domain-containing protein [Sulfuricurvum sp.]
MDIRLFLNRIKNETDIKTDKELAEAMGVKYGTLTKWLARNSVPKEPMIEFVVSRGLDLNELFADNIKENADRYASGSSIPRLTKSAIDSVIEKEALAFAEQFKETYKFIAEYGSMPLLKKFEEEVSALSASYIEKCEKLREILEE